MLPFFLTIGIISGLIIGGVSLSCYLNKQGVFGKQRLISAQRYRAFEDEYVVEEESGDQLAMSAVEEAESSRYARKGLLVCLGGLAVVVMLMSTLVSVLLH